MNQPANETISPTEKVAAVKRARQAELLRKANVVGVGVGYRRRRGQQTDTVALVVMVSRKLPREQLAPEDLLPRELDGVPVDVQEVGELRAF
ncbi:MAG: hypothetical protein QME21_18940 [Anaerolineales bacterium]|nr:hypothetical protein [Anaerolineales bacterium]